MDEPRPQKFLIVENDVKYASWVQHALGTHWPAEALVIMDWSSFGRVRTAMTVRDYDIVLLALAFEEGIEDPSESLDWIRKLRSQPGFPEMIVLADGGSELVAVRTLRLGASDYLPKRLLTPARLQRSLKLTLRAIEKENARRAERAASAAPRPEADKAAVTIPPAAAKPAAPPHIATHTGASLAQAARLATVKPETDKAAMSMPAARPATKPAPTSATPASPVSTHTGASLATAARAAISAASAAPSAPPVPTAAASTSSTTPPIAAKPHAAPPADIVARDPALSLPAVSLPAVSLPAVSLPAVSSPSASLPSASLPGVSLPGVSLPAPQSKESKYSIPEWHRIPGYTILQRIGESEAAAVYLAIAEDLGHDVALKVTKRRHTGGDSGDTGQRQILFQREFEAIAALDHPSIIDLYDYGIHEGTEYLAMEYFPCGDLKARLQNPLTADEAIAFLREIARSLKVVHDAGIIHRDLKPPNVMLRDDGSVVLIDFGLARSLLSGDSSTRTGVLRGSPYYMSPEQAQGEPLDARTDLYSLGVILYEMLAGKKPYLGASAIDVLQQHVMAPVPELPVHHLIYQPLLERLMSKSREQRIASCDELLSALEKMARSLGEGLIDPETLVSAGATS